MRQVGKGKNYFFGMKLHIGLDSDWGLVHSAVVTPANVHDKHPLPDLLHGEEFKVYGDSAYAGQQELIERKAASQGLHEPTGAQDQRRARREAAA